MAWEANRRRARLPGDWRTRRARVLRRDAHTCQLQFEGCTEIATEVDHIEPGDNHRYSNLQAVCTECHKHKTYHHDRPNRVRPPEDHPGLI